MLSIVVPFFNAGKYLKQCIDSIREQTFTDFELLLVDDGSEDESVDICKEYSKKDNRISLLEGKHAGPFKARKMGVERAKGDYITFVDADDFISKDSFIYAKKDMDNEIDVISFDIYRYYNEDVIKYDEGWSLEKIYDKEMIIHEMYPTLIWDEKCVSFGLDPSLWSKIFKASLIKNIFEGINNLNFHYGEDVAVIYPLMLKAESISVHRESYYYHRQRSTGEVPAYIMDETFLDKLYELYTYLLEKMGSDFSFRKQIELFYIHSVNFAKRKYGLSSNTIDDIFPFDQVKKGEKIAIYGAGNLGKLYVKQLSMLHYCDVVLWVDKAVKGNGVVSPEMIKDVNFDKIVIAISNKYTQKEIVEWLIQKGIDEKRIVRR